MFVPAPRAREWALTISAYKANFTKYALLLEILADIEFESISTKVLKESGLLAAVAAVIKLNISKEITALAQRVMKSFEDQMEEDLRFGVFEKILLQGQQKNPRGKLTPVLVHACANRETAYSTVLRSQLVSVTKEMRANKQKFNSKQDDLKLALVRHLRRERQKFADPSADEKKSAPTTTSLGKFTAAFLEDGLPKEQTTQPKETVNAARTLGQKRKTILLPFRGQRQPNDKKQRID